MKKLNNKYLLGPSIVSLIVVLLLVISLKIDLTSLMSNMTYQTISIQEREKYTLEAEYVAECQSSDSSIVKTQVVGGKCNIIGVSKGKTDVELLTVAGDIEDKQYQVNVESYVSLGVRRRLSTKIAGFKVDTNNMDNIQLKYCLIGKDGICNQLDITSEKTINIGNIDKKIEKVCLYAYDGELLDNVCVERGIFRIFW